MLTLELEPELEIDLKTIAQKEQCSVNDIIKQLIKSYLEEKQESDDLLVDIANLLPRIACFENQDPLELQKAMRDEWH
jgi:predicted DNA-binding ribbon-helix-helix protein